MTGSLLTLHKLPLAVSFNNVRTWLLIIASIVLLGVVYMGQASQAAMTGRRVHDKQDKLARIMQENVQLQADIAALLAPDRIEKRARALGLRLATPDQVKYMVVKDYPVEPSRPELSASAGPESVAAGQPDASAWWSDLLKRVGLYVGPRSAEATSSP